jgi:hypothetical protein
MPMPCKIGATISGLINIYALTNRIRLISTQRVVKSADTVCRIIVDASRAKSDIGGNADQLD